MAVRERQAHHRRGDQPREELVAGDVGRRPEHVSSRMTIRMSGSVISGRSISEAMLAPADERAPSRRPRGRAPRACPPFVGKRDVEQREASRPLTTASAQRDWFSYSVIRRP